LHKILARGLRLVELAPKRGRTINALGGPLHFDRALHGRSHDRGGHHLLLDGAQDFVLQALASQAQRIGAGRRAAMAAVVADVNG
jgi:hypothetical protein